jgi:hypothetical protein
MATGSNTLAGRKNLLDPNLHAPTLSVEFAWRSGLHLRERRPGRAGRLRHVQASCPDRRPGCPGLLGGWLRSRA